VCGNIATFEMSWPPMLPVPRHRIFVKASLPLLPGPALAYEVERGGEVFISMTVLRVGEKCPCRER
jgi:hypothetical protein